MTPQANAITRTLIPTGEIPGSTCPRCAAPLMVVTKLKHQYFTAHPQFIGCTAYPFCGYVTSEISDEVVAKMQAVQEEREAVTVDF